MNLGFGLAQRLEDLDGGTFRVAAYGCFLDDVANLAQGATVFVVVAMTMMFV